MSEYRENPNARALLKAAVREGVNAYLLVVSRALREQLSKPGGGRVYRVAQGRGRRARNAREAGWHRASRPGQPPAVDTGMLRRSWQLGRSQLRGNVVAGDAGGVGGSANGGGMSTGRRMRRGQTQIVSATLGILDSDNRVAYRFGSALRYARIEFGYGRASARPYIRPTLAVTRDLFPAVMATALRRNLGGGRK